MRKPSLLLPAVVSCRSRRLPRVLGAVLCCALIAACGGPLIGVNVFVVGERTSLERQVLGTYRSLHADFESFGSVRGVDEFGRVRRPPPVTESKRAAISAMRNRAYNRDDVDDFLGGQLVGEGNSGMLEVFDEKLSGETPARREFLLAVVEEENRDREKIIERLMGTTPGLNEDDAGRVRAIFASLNRDAAPKGARIQTEDGVWLVK